MTADLIAQLEQPRLDDMHLDQPLRGLHSMRLGIGLQKKDIEIGRLAEADLDSPWPPVVLLGAGRNPPEFWPQFILVDRGSGFLSPYAGELTGAHDRRSVGILRESAAVRRSRPERQTLLLLKQPAVERHPNGRRSHRFRRARRGGSYNRTQSSCPSDKLRRVQPLATDDQPVAQLPGNRPRTLPLDRPLSQRSDGGSGSVSRQFAVVDHIRSKERAKGRPGKFAAA